MDQCQGCCQESRLSVVERDFCFGDVGTSTPGHSEEVLFLGIGEASGLALPEDIRRLRERGLLMDNQHRKISGYRELEEEEIALMNEIKAMGLGLGQMIEKLRSTEGLDQRWVSIGATDLQTGLMALTRAVAKPTFF